MSVEFYNRYSVSENEDFEPGSNEVLKNFLGITVQYEIEQLEATELLRASQIVPTLYHDKYRFCSDDLCNIHELWLASIYPFAGKYRTVMMSKGGFPFAHPERIPQLMSDLELHFLAKYTPCTYMSSDKLAEALGIVHTEFIVIHPFREGNGRVSRVLANLMALQAGKGALNYTLIDRTVNKEGYDDYIRAIQEGFCGHYQRIIELFRKMIVDQPLAT